MYVKFSCAQENGGKKADSPYRPHVGLDIRHFKTQILPQVDKQAQQGNRATTTPLREPRTATGAARSECDQARRPPETAPYPCAPLEAEVYWST